MLICFFTVFASSEPVPGFQGDTLQLAFIDLRQVKIWFSSWEEIYFLMYGLGQHTVLQFESYISFCMSQISSFYSSSHTQTEAWAPCLPFCCKHLWYVKCCWPSLTRFCVDTVNLSPRRRLGAVSSPSQSTILRIFWIHRQHRAQTDASTENNWDRT